MVESVHVVLETLPLRLLAVPVKLLVGGICSVDEAVVHRGLNISLADSHCCAGRERRLT